MLVCFNRALAERFKAVAPEGVQATTFHGLIARFRKSRSDALDYRRMGKPCFWRL